MRRFSVLTAAVCSIAGFSLALAQTPEIPTALSVKEVMHYVINPAAETFWKAGGEVDTADGAEKRTPISEEQWAATEHAAAVLHESGGVLLAAGRNRDEPEWRKFSQDLAAAGVLALRAAQARDDEKIFEAGSAVYDSCFGCHRKYIPRQGPPLP